MIVVLLILAAVSMLALTAFCAGAAFPDGAGPAFSP